MMGSGDKPQDELFYAFNLDDVVPQDHLLRDIDRLLDFTELREHLSPYYSHTGRPSVDPELMIRMLLIGYCCGIRSERQLCYEVTMNLAYRWFCKLSINDKVPNHSTFSKNRHGRFRAEFLNWMVNEAKIEPHVPVWERGEGEDDRFGRSDFTYNEETDRYTCPNSKELLRSRRNYKVPRPTPKNDFINYRAAKADCSACPMKNQCCPNAAAKKLLRSIYEKERDVAREVAKTPAYQKTRHQRKQVEMLFAHMKRILKMDRLRLRGLSGARDEFLLTATAQNLRRMAKYLGTGPPEARASPMF